MGPETGPLAAAGGGADAAADAGVISVAAGGGATCGVVGTDGGSGLAARPLVNPCDRSLAAVAGVGRPAGVVGVPGMLGVAGMEGVDGIDGVRIGLADMPDAGLRGGMMPALPV